MIVIFYYQYIFIAINSFLSINHYCIYLKLHIFISIIGFIVNNYIFIHQIIFVGFIMNLLLIIQVKYSYVHIFIL
jgi:hypothetical protein